MKINLYFPDTISEAYREKLQIFSDKILAEGITENRPPRIAFAGMNRATFIGIESLRYAYARRYEVVTDVKDWRNALNDNGRLKERNLNSKSYVTLFVLIFSFVFLFFIVSHFVCCEQLLKLSSPQ